MLPRTMFAAYLPRSAPRSLRLESGFPYGHNQWISVAASSWATMALILTVKAPVNSTDSGAP